MRVGLFFGTFNPIHVGHLVIGQHFLNTGAIDQLWFVVSPQNPFRKKETLAPETKRLEMVELALQEHPYMFASNVEFFLPRPSYTIHTLTHLSEQYPSYEFHLLMGQDNLLHFHRWKKWEVILRYYPIWVYPRKPVPDSVWERYPQVNRIEGPLLHISASEIRRLIAQGKGIYFMVPEPVRKYIEREGLYAKPSAKSVDTR